MKFENIAILAGAVAVAFWLISMNKKANQIAEGANSLGQNTQYDNYGTPKGGDLIEV